MLALGAAALAALVVTATPGPAGASTARVGQSLRTGRGTLRSRRHPPFRCAIAAPCARRRSRSCSRRAPRPLSRP